MALVVPPAECVLDVLDRFGKVVVHLIMLGTFLTNGYVTEVRVVVVVLPLWLVSDHEGR